MTGVKLVLAAGLALVAIFVIVTLSHVPMTLAGTNSVQAESKLARTTGTHTSEGCQAGETLPRNASAVRLSLFAAIGPEVTVDIFAGSHRLTSGTHPPGWVGSVVTVPVKPVPHAHSQAKLCFRLTSINGPIQVIGEDTSPAEAVVSNGEPLAGRIRVEYLRPGERSWLSLATSLARRLGFGHAANGLWDVLLVMALATAVIALSTALALRELR
jgi:hypothetical protein